MMGSSWLYLQGGRGGGISGRKGIAAAANLFFFAVNAWGLWNSTSRSAVFSYAVGLCVLALLSARSMGTRKALARASVILALLAATFFGTLLFGRGNVFIMKSVEMVEQFKTIGKRDSIWLTTAEMFKMHPLGGVGLGHYKWNYLEAQRRMVAKHPDMKWQYTYWAQRGLSVVLRNRGVRGPGTHRPRGLVAQMFPLQAEEGGHPLTGRDLGLFFFVPDLVRRALDAPLP